MSNENGIVVCVYCGDDHCGTDCGNSYEPKNETPAELVAMLRELNHNTYAMLGLTTNLSAPELVKDFTERAKNTGQSADRLEELKAKAEICWLSGCASPIDCSQENPDSVLDLGVRRIKVSDVPETIEKLEAKVRAIENSKVNDFRVEAQYMPDVIGVNDANVMRSLEAVWKIEVHAIINGRPFSTASYVNQDPETFVKLFARVKGAFDRAKEKMEATDATPN